MEKENQRRKFLKTTAAIGALTSTGIGFLPGCKEESNEGGQKVSPPEDLMQEHGLLNRILLIYDHFKIHLLNKTEFQKEALLNAAEIIRSFVEDYHEKQEEDYL